MLTHRRVTPSIKFFRTHLYIHLDGEAPWESSVLAKNTWLYTMSPAGTSTQTAWSEGEHTNQEATTSYEVSVFVLYFWPRHLRFVWSPIHIENEHISRENLNCQPVMVLEFFLSAYDLLVFFAITTFCKPRSNDILINGGNNISNLQ